MRKDKDSPVVETEKQNVAERVREVVFSKKLVKRWILFLGTNCVSVTALFYCSI